MTIGYDNLGTQPAAALPVSPLDLFPVSQGGVWRKLTAGQLAAAASQLAGQPAVDAMVAAALPALLAALPYAARSAVYAEELGVVAGVGGPAVGNTAILNAAFAAGVTVWLRAGATYDISSTLLVRGNSGLVGQPGGAKPVVRMPLAYFTRSENSGATRYAANAVGIMARGGTSAPYTPLTGVTLRDFDVLCEGGDGRALSGVVLANLAAPTVRNVVVRGLPLGVGWRINSVTGGRIADCGAADFYSNTVWPADTAPQLSGFELDNDTINGVGTTGLTLTDLWAANIVVGPAFLAASGDQSDFLTLANNLTRHNVLRGLRADGVGEGVDCFGCYNTLSDLELTNCRLYGLKLIHGAKGNTINNAVVRRPGLAGLTLAGTTGANGDTADNLISNLLVDEVDPDLLWGASSCGVQITDNGGTGGKPRGNTVQGARILLGANGKVGWNDFSSGSRNYGYNVAVRAGPSTTNVSVVQARTSGVQLAGSPATWRTSTLRQPVPTVCAVVVAADYTPTLNETFVNVVANSPLTITLPPGWSGTVGDRNGTAGTNSITVQRLPASVLSAGATGTLLTVASASAPLHPGARLTGGGMTAGQYVLEQLTGAALGAGTYRLALPQADVAPGATVTAAAEGAIVGAGTNGNSFTISANGGSASLVYKDRGDGWLRTA